MDEHRQADLLMDNAENPLSNSSQKWILTPVAFENLLQTLDPNRDNAAKKYLEIRNNLLRFFEWRGCPFPEDHADDTFNRVARKIAEGEEIRNPGGYIMGVARLLALEIFKSHSRQREALEDYQQSYDEVAEVPNSDTRIDCLEKCLQQLSSDNRDLITQYYQGDKGEKIENRRKLSERLGVTVSTLRMRTRRLREQLQVCVEGCVSAA